MKKCLKEPFDIVAAILKVPVESLNKDSTMGEHPHWDSLNHIGIIVEIENSYGISIPDEDIMKYSNMNAIIELHRNLLK